MLHPVEPDLRSGVLFPIESGRWIASVVGVGGEPPKNDVEFDAAVRSLRSPLIAQAIMFAEPITRVHGSRGLSNLFRHYERWKSPPDGFVALGDAVCSPNPVYAQGMTLAALCASTLTDTISSYGSGRELPARFFRAQARVLQDPWRMAINADFRFGTTTGPRPPLVGLINSYFDSVVDASADDPALATALYRMINMVKSPSSLLSPGIGARVLAVAVKRSLQRATRRGQALEPTGLDRA
jgi:2-polyprenyl-6-methoxyphenol hydroxylase-like FAD-dependent oxidoreductase